MRKKFLATLLSLAMLLSLLPTWAMAEGEGPEAEPGNEAPTSVAQIGEGDNAVGYPTLAAAIAAVPDNTETTITMLDDVNGAHGISVPSGRNITVDFAGHTYSVEKPGAGSSGTKTQAFQLLEGSNITFKNGTISCTEANKTATWNSDSTEKGVAMVIQNYANLTLDNMTIDGTNIAHNGAATRYVMSNNCGTVNINNSTITAVSGDFAFDSCKYGNYDAPTVDVTTSAITGKVEATGGAINFKAGTTVDGMVRVGENKSGGATGSVVTIEKDAEVINSNYVAVFGANTLNIYGEVDGCVCTNGYDYNAGSIINIYDGAVVTNSSTLEDGDAVYMPNGTLNISGGTITGTTAVYFKSTTLNITGGTFIGTGEQKDYSYYGNGGRATGDALVIDSCNYPNGISGVSVSGGSFKSEHSNAVMSFVSQGANLVTKFITGGTFSGKLDEALLAKDYTQLASGKVAKQLAGGIAVTGDEDELTAEEEGAATEAIGEITEQLADDGAVAKANATAVAGITGVETLEVKQTAMVMTTTTTGEGSTAAPAVKSITFDVTPKDAKDAAVTVLGENKTLTFQLPVPDAWAGRDVKVEHTHGNEETVSFAKVQCTDGNHYVSVTSGKFSLYNVTALTAEELEKALEETDYGVMVKYNDGSVTYYIYSEDPNEDELYDAIVDAIESNAELVLLRTVEVYENVAEAVNKYIKDNNINAPFKVRLNDHEFIYPWAYGQDGPAPYTIVNAPEADTLTLVDTTGSEKPNYNVGDPVTVTPTMSAGGYDGVSLEVAYDKTYLQPQLGENSEWTIVSNDTDTEKGYLRYFNYTGVTSNTLPSITFKVIKAEPKQISINAHVSVNNSQYVVGMSSLLPYSFIATEATIGIASIEVTLPEAKTAVYSGDSIPSNTLTGEGYTVSGTGSEAASYNGTTGTLSAENVGSYTVTLTLNDYNVGRYKWPALATGTDGFTDNNDGTATFTALKIEQADNVFVKVTVADASNNVVEFDDRNTYTFNVDAKFGGTTSEASETITYAYAKLETEEQGLEGLAYNLDKPTDAGKYAVKVTIPATTNYDEVTGYGTFTIEKGTLTVTEPVKAADTPFTEADVRNGYKLITEGSIQYGGATVPTEEYEEYGMFCYYCGAAAPAAAESGSTAVPMAYTVGDYTVWYKFVPGSNYEVTGVTANEWIALDPVKISKGTLSVDWFSVTKSENDGKPATGSAQTVLSAGATTTSVVGVPTSPNFAYRYAATKVVDGETTPAAPADGWVDNYTALTVKDQGTYRVWIEVKDIDNNYETESFNMGTFELTQGEYTAFLIKGYLVGKNQNPKDLILVFAKTGLGFKYGSKAMVDVTGMGYLSTFDTIKGRVGSDSEVTMDGQTGADGNGYGVVYAYLVSDGKLTDVKMTGTNVSFNTLSTFKGNVYDVNVNGSTDVGDASSIRNVYQNGTAATTALGSALRADTNRDSVIDLDGADAIREWYLSGTGSAAPTAPAVN